MQRKIDYSAFFQCSEVKAIYITAKYGIPHEELKQFFIYITANWNRYQISMQNQGQKESSEHYTRLISHKIIGKFRLSDTQEDLPVVCSKSSTDLLNIIHDIMDFKV